MISFAFASFAKNPITTGCCTVNKPLLLSESMTAKAKNVLHVPDVVTAMQAST